MQQFKDSSKHYKLNLLGLDWLDFPLTHETPCLASAIQSHIKIIL